jgi:hypothetical protein
MRLRWWCVSACVVTAARVVRVLCAHHPRRRPSAPWRRRRRTGCGATRRTAARCGADVRLRCCVSRARVSKRGCHHAIALHSLAQHATQRTWRRRPGGVAGARPRSRLRRERTSARLVWRQRVARARRCGAARRPPPRAATACGPPPGAWPSSHAARKEDALQGAKSSALLAQARRRGAPRPTGKTCLPPAPQPVAEEACRSLRLACG